MGITIIAVTATCFFIYFPDQGSMLTGPKSLGSYDPQIIKPPEGYRGADSMDFNAAAGTDTSGKPGTTPTSDVAVNAA